MNIQIQDAIDNLETSDTVRLWTWQTPEAYAKLCRNGVLYGDGRRVYGFYREHYQWMMDQLARHLGRPVKRYPIWAWYYPKPDMRERLPLWLYGQPKVLLELQVEKSNALFVDYEAWDLAVDGDCYLPENQADWDDFQTREDILDWEDSPIVREHEARRVASRQRMFDLTWRSNLDFDIARCNTYRRFHIQATLPELRLEQVLAVKKYDS